MYVMYQVLTETIPLDPAFEEALNDRLVLIFTGKQRLARSARWFRPRVNACLGDGKNADLPPSLEVDSMRRQRQSTAVLL